MDRLHLHQQAADRLQPIQLLLRRVFPRHMHLAEEFVGESQRRAKVRNGYALASTLSLALCLLRRRQATAPSSAIKQSGLARGFNTQQGSAAEIIAEVDVSN